MSLLAPVVRQVLAQSQESRRRELDRLTALKQRAHHIRMTRRLPLPARRTFASIDRTTGSRPGRWPLSPTCSAAAIFARLSWIPIRSAATVIRSTISWTRLWISVEMIETFYASHIKNTLDAAAINVRKGTISRERKKRKDEESADDHNQT
jgi:hypothetical protein